MLLLEVDIKAFLFYLYINTLNAVFSLLYTLNQDRSEQNNTMPYNSLLRGL